MKLLKIVKNIIKLRKYSRRGYVSETLADEVLTELYEYIAPKDMSEFGVVFGIKDKKYTQLKGTGNVYEKTDRNSK